MKLTDTISILAYWRYQESGKISDLGLTEKQVIELIDEVTELNLKDRSYNYAIAEMRRYIITKAKALTENDPVAALHAEKIETEKTLSTREQPDIYDLVCSMEYIFKVPIDPQTCSIAKFYAYYRLMTKITANGNK